MGLGPFPQVIHKDVWCRSHKNCLIYWSVIAKMSVVGVILLSIESEKLSLKKGIQNEFTKK